MLISAAITPHSPLFIPAIGKKNINLLDASNKAFAKIEENIYQRKIGSIIIISPHGSENPDCFNINLAVKYFCNFEKFGDFATKFEFNGDVVLSAGLKQKAKGNFPVELISEANLDYGSSIPIFKLSQHLPDIKITPIYCSGLSLEEHFNFGKFLKNEIVKSKQRIMVIASGELSHRLSKNGPGGYSPKGAKFDQKIIEIIKNKKTPSLLELKPESIKEAGECGLRSIALLLGVLDEINYEAIIRSYEYPFGVGYLTCEFIF